MEAQFVKRIQAVTGAKVAHSAPLGGGSIAEVTRVDLTDGTTLAVKTGRNGSRFDVEAFMLDYLAQNSELPVPAVIHAEDDLLILEYIEAGGALDRKAEHHAAELLAALHGIAAPEFGFERPTLIGGLDQPNPWSDDWIAFFRDQRLLYMADEAVSAGRLRPGTRDRIERFAAKLGDFLPAHATPSLIHGDMWGGNVLCQAGRIAAFVDPAIYYADAEIELAFATLFSTFGEAFFARYREIRPIAPGFFEERRDIYNLYPLLVHVRLFGSGYVGSVTGTLTRLGF